MLSPMSPHALHPFCLSACERQVSPRCILVLSALWQHVRPPHVTANMQCRDPACELRAPLSGRPSHIPECGPPDLWFGRF